MTGSGLCSISLFLLGERATQAWRDLLRSESRERWVSKQSGSVRLCCHALLISKPGITKSMWRSCLRRIIRKKRALLGWDERAAWHHWLMAHFWLSEHTCWAVQALSGPSQADRLQSLARRSLWWGWPSSGYLQRKSVASGCLYCPSNVTGPRVIKQNYMNQTEAQRQWA